VSQTRHLGEIMFWPDEVFGPANSPVLPIHNGRIEAVNLKDAYICLAGILCWFPSSHPSKGNLPQEDDRCDSA